MSRGVHDGNCNQGLLVRIAGGEFAEVVVNLKAGKVQTRCFSSGSHVAKACVMGPREGRLSRQRSLDSAVGN